MRSGGPTSAMSWGRLKCKVDIIFDTFSETADCLRDRKLISRLMLMLSAPRETPGWSNLLGSAVRSIGILNAMALTLVIVPTRAHASPECQLLRRVCHRVAVRSPWMWRCEES